MKYSLRTLMIVVTLVCVVLGGVVVGRMEYLRQMAAFHLDESIRLIHTKHAWWGDAIPDATAAIQHGDLSFRFHKAASHPWMFVDTTPRAVLHSDAQFLAEDMVAGNIARQFLPDENEEAFNPDELAETRSYQKLVADAYNRYLREHRVASQPKSASP